ncbi:hypothetical protein CR513_34660, partial [Mucuna pruriens]
MLITISLTTFSSCPASSNRSSKSVSAFVPPFFISPFLVFMISATDSWTSPTASLSDLSDPMLSILFAFHTKNTGAAARAALISEAVSNAVSSGGRGFDVSRQHGSLPSETLHTVSNVSLRNTSCRSITWPSRAARSKSGISLCWTSSWSVFTVKSFSDRVLNSWLANFRCVCHSSPSVLKMPRPRRSPRISVKGLPFGKLAKLVFRMYSTLRGFAVTTVRRAPRRRTTTVWVGDWAKCSVYQSRRRWRFW